MSSQRKNPAARAGANRVIVLAGVKTSPANLIGRSSNSLSEPRLRRLRRSGRSRSRGCPFDCNVARDWASACLIRFRRGFRRCI